MKEIIAKIARLPAWFVIIFIIASWITTYLDMHLASVLGVVGLTWYFSVGYELHSKVPSDINISLRWFIVSLIYPYLYLLLSSPLFENDNIEGMAFAIFNFLHLFAMYCILYSFYFISKALVSIEEGTSVRLHNYIGTLFMIWFFPIGMWFVIPRIQRQLVSANE